jgi:hypothetical protein
VGNYQKSGTYWACATLSVPKVNRQLVVHVDETRIECARPSLTPWSFGSAPLVLPAKRNASFDWPLGCPIWDAHIKMTETYLQESEALMRLKHHG